MSNLLSEYRRRHKADFIWVTNDGVCFFNKNRNPEAICIVSDPVRSIANCPDCNNTRQSLTCEILTPASDQRGTVYKTAYHTHIAPDADLNAVVLDVLGRGYVPFLARDQRDIEVWLWNFFLQTQPFTLRGKQSWDNFLKDQRREQASNIDKAYAQMLWCVHMFPTMMKLFYEAVYQQVCIGRNYLLYR